MMEMHEMTGEEGEVTYEDQLDAAEMLGEMVQSLMDRLPSEDEIAKEDMRPDVIAMWGDYIEGEWPAVFSGSRHLSWPGQVNSRFCRRCWSSARPKSGR